MLNKSCKHHNCCDVFLPKHSPKVLISTGNWTWGRSHNWYMRRNQKIKKNKTKQKKTNARTLTSDVRAWCTIITLKKKLRFRSEKVSSFPFYYFLTRNSPQWNLHWPFQVFSPPSPLHAVSICLKSIINSFHVKVQSVALNTSFP